MKKVIQLTPEWVLNKLSHSHYADGKGNLSVQTGHVSDANWIALALNTLDVTYEEYEFYDDETFLFSFDFKLEDIKKECPLLYKNFTSMDDHNKIFRGLK